MASKTFFAPVPGLALCLALAFTHLAGLACPAHAIRDGRNNSQPTNNERELARLRRIMTPLLKATNRSSGLDQVTIKIVDDQSINAGSAGSGEFLVTTGLLRRANDEQLRGVLAHEVAHDDLGHPAKMQLIGTGLSLGVALLEKVFPGSGNITPIAGTLIASSYSRPQELAADRHAVLILRRAGYSKDSLLRALEWIEGAQGDSGGGIFSTHPATGERIRILKQL